MLYTAYGLTVRSRLRLPELPEEPDSGRGADVDVRLGRVPSENRESRDSLHFRIPGTAGFLVSGGREIVVEPEGGADEDGIRLFLLGSAFGALLFQRGHLVLHGSAVRVGDDCLVCVGRSGAGKSTLSAGFMKRGHQILSDDVIPVDGSGRAIPSFPRIKLWQDATDLLGITTDRLRRIRPGVEKFDYPLRERFAGRPLPIQWIYVLDSHDKPDVLIEPIDGMKRLHPLREHTYRAFFLETMGLKPEHLRSCARLASGIRLARVTRPSLGFGLDALMDRILSDVREHPGRGAGSIRPGRW